MRITIMAITAIAFVSSSLIVANEVIETGELTRLTMWLAVISCFALLALVSQIGGMAAARGRSSLSMDANGLCQRMDSLGRLSEPCE